jgi:hypothetical protein
MTSDPDEKSITQVVRRHPDRRTKCSDCGAPLISADVLVDDRIVEVPWEFGAGYHSPRRCQLLWRALG